MIYIHMIENVNNRSKFDILNNTIYINSNLIISDMTTLIVSNLKHDRSETIIIQIYDKAETFRYSYI